MGAAPLPGRGEPVRFPDSAFLAGHDLVPVLDENLAARPAGDVPPPLVVVSREELRRRAEATDHLPYLRFQPPADLDDRVRVSVEARLAGAGGGAPELGLGGIVVTYADTEGTWQTVGEPATFAL